MKWSIIGWLISILCAVVFNYFIKMETPGQFIIGAIFSTIGYSIGSKFD